MPYSYTLSTAIPAAAAEIYDAWLDSIAHAEMTGGGEAVMSDEIGAEVSAWAGYITGRNLELVPAERIVQSWRTTEFDDEIEDSIVTILLQETEDGTLLTLEHSNVPDLHKSYEEGGWQSNYFEPMIAYFSEFEEDFTEPGQQPQSAQPAESDLEPDGEAEPETAVEHHPRSESLQHEARREPTSGHKSEHEDWYNGEPEPERKGRPIAPEHSAAMAPGAQPQKARGRERGAGGSSAQGVVSGATANKRSVAAAGANKKAARPAPDKKAAKPAVNKKTVTPATNKKAAKPAAKKAAKPSKPPTKKKSSAKKKTAKSSTKKKAANKSAQRLTKRRTAKTVGRSSTARSRKAARRKR
jgi:uncharacterized protein YndB with AHSA1/START domain